jgi:hypothetical protein
LLKIITWVTPDCANYGSLHFTFLILRFLVSNIEANCDFLSDYVRWQTRELYELVCTDFYEIVLLKFIINQKKKKIK